MRCIFCKVDSTKSNSVEHIIPESLGNKNHVLPKGVVCDNCNNYFATKIEKPVLEMSYFKSLRGRNEIRNKKGKRVGIPAYLKNFQKEELNIYYHDGNKIEAVVKDKSLFDTIGKYNKLYIPILPKPPINDIQISKFIGKIALEALALKVSQIEGWQDDFNNNESLDQLREFVRYGRGYKIWPYLTRRIYAENHISLNQESNVGYEILHEFDFLIPEEPVPHREQYRLDNLYFLVAIMGIEYTLNMTNAGLGSYLKWLDDNQGKSILISK